MNQTFGAAYFETAELPLHGGRTSNLYTMVSGGVTYIWSAESGWTRQD